MKRVLSADCFEFRKSKMTYILPSVSVLLGILMPLMYYGIYALFKYLGSLDIMEGQTPFASLNALLETLNAKTVFLSVLPISQGIGLVITAMIGFRAVRPFGTGVYRNKVIAQVPRGAIYLSQSLYCLILTMVSAVLYALTAALSSSLTFGSLDLSGREVLVIALLSIGIYLVYTAIPVFVAFLTRSVPLTLIVSILLPVLSQTVVSLVSTALMSAPKSVLNAIAVLPAFQNAYLMVAEASDTVLLISLASDVAIAALLTVTGILRFRKRDVN